MVIDLIMIGVYERKPFYTHVMVIDLMLERKYLWRHVMIIDLTKDIYLDELQLVFMRRNFSIDILWS